MIQVFKCPSCGASLSYEGDPEPTLTCQFCGSTVVVPEELRAKSKPSPSSASAPGLDLGGTLAGLPLDKLTELKRLVHGGQKIEAIKLYREIFNVGLKEAKDAVEKLETGEPLVFTSATVETPGATEASQSARLTEMMALMQAGRKIEAIKLFRETFGVGLKEAKDAVDAMEAGGSADVSQFTVQSSRASAVSADKATRLVDVIDLVRAGQKIEAIKLYREIFGVGLKEAKDAVEAMAPGAARPGAAAQARRAVRAAGCVSTGFGALIVVCIAGFVGAMVWGAPFRLSGSYRQALAAAQSDPNVIEALGAPIEPSWLPITGELSCGGGSCSANYRIPIRGSQKSGAIVVFSDSKGAGFFNEGTWILNARVVVDDGPSLELTPPPTPAPTLGAAQIDATAGAEARATRQAQATLDAEAAATARAMRDATATAGAAATAQAIANTTATAEAQATATAVSLILTPQEAWPVVFSDPFEGNRNGWHTGDIKETSVTAQRRIADGQYLWDITSQHDIFWSTWPDRGKAFGDFYAGVEGQVLKGGSVPTYGLVFRLGDENDFYYFGINDDGYYHFDVYEGGANTSLPIVYGIDAVHKGGVNRLTVSASGPHFILLVNDEVVGVFDDDHFASGAIGLGMTAYEQGGEAAVAFDNFEVRAP